MNHFSWVKQFGASVTSAAKTVFGVFDATDVFVFLGLVLVGYGLNLRWGLWLACVVCGSAVFWLGVMMLAMKTRGKP